MKKNWSGKWASSVQPRKQRKYAYNAPLHIKHKFVSVHLSPVLRERYGKRSVPVRNGDKVKVLRGEKKGFTGSVEKVSLEKIVVYIDGLKTKKVDGTEILKGIKPSNLMIIELNTDDKMRQSKLLRQADNAKDAVKPKPAASEKKKESKEPASAAKKKKIKTAEASKKNGNVAGKNPSAKKSDTDKRVNK
ncbi:MAG: 50S ribosomal protein L24 [Candidatus Micrarchaeota archaeon]|nr:50S ribosomal protein L24 [Candidatus Micrarchaeota archaeon]